MTSVPLKSAQLHASDQQQPKSHLALFVRYGNLKDKNCNFSIPPFHLTLSFQVNPLEFLDKLYLAKTRVLLGLFVSEDLVILVWVILI